MTENSEKLQKVMDSIRSSKKAVRVLPSDNHIKEEFKRIYKINPQSLLGVLLENTGGIVIDNWLRLYGTGEINFAERNKLFPFEEVVIAGDILGGLFIYLDNGNIDYFAPDNLELEDMEIGMGQFLYWCLHGDTDTFYIDYRWEGWQAELSGISYDEGVAFYPFLWAQAESFKSRERKIVPMEEIIGLEFEFLRQMMIEKSV